MLPILPPDASSMDVEDFGGVDAGATIIPALTSPTYQPHECTKVRLIKCLLGFPPRLPPTSPLTTIASPPTSHNICWPFHGPRGTIGIRFPYGIFVSTSTISLVQAEHLRHASPWQLVLWGVIPKSKVDLMPMSCRQGNTSFPFQDDPSFFKQHALWLADWEVPGKDVLCAGTVIQSVCNTTVEAVVLEIRSNWGGSFTCIHHIHTYGRRADYL
ncbi:hypothetical protein OF83DRAFT_1180348 [Amylostereum chailletii]|nr:hypothetical protein OF83DRAFT_1180348 [Amylostereum chailletii]